MNKRKKILILIGGTGGHVFPGCNLATHLVEKNYEVKVLTDKRGVKYLDRFKNLDISSLPSSPLITKNIFKLIFSSSLIFYSFLRSIIFLLLNKPSIIIGMGGHASFPACIAAIFLKIEFVIYENNLIIGKANKYLTPFAKKILVSHRQLEGIPKKYNYKVVEIGNIINKEIIEFSKKDKNNKNFQKLNILVLGGSQAAKIFAETLPKIFQKCSQRGFALRIYQHCLPSQNNDLKLFYEKTNIEFESFNFSNNLLEYFSKIDLAITRSGSSVLAELTNAKIPFISVPLPSSADNHQLKNAIFYQKKDLSFLVEEKDLNSSLINHIQKIYENKSVLNNIIKNQSQYSDKNVYENINIVLKEIINEKN